MARKTLGCIVLLVSSALFAGACDAADPDVPEDTGTTEDAPLSIEDAIVLPRCGGIAGFVCPVGYRCVDLPGDGCDPMHGGADCLGVCRPPQRELACSDPSRVYKGRTAEICMRIRYYCEEGEPFSDDCGCGCIVPRRINSAIVASCGDKVCGSDEYCCNRSCGICAPTGSSCIQVECVASTE